jgi:hypothetical protein
VFISSLTMVMRLTLCGLDIMMPDEEITAYALVNAVASFLTYVNIGL